MVFLHQAGGVVTNVGSFDCAVSENAGTDFTAGDLIELRSRDVICAEWTAANNVAVLVTIDLGVRSSGTCFGVGD